uniref:Uncharacterized protein n=1 Tax=Neogobius melanostomus TaxID=47308 RepID=A0A8C6X0G5_9GOBI
KWLLKRPLLIHFATPKHNPNICVSSTSITHKEHPKDIFPLVLTTVTQVLFECEADEDVTADSPYKLLLKDDILQDMRKRAAVSDFSPVKKTIQEYPEDELLLVYDRDFTYGNNFYLVLTPEAKDKLLKPQPPKPPSPVEPVIEICKTPEPIPWVSLGSEVEIEEESVKETREKLWFKFSRVRRKFGTAVCFSDRSAADVKDGYLECASYQDSRFSIKQMQRDSAGRSSFTKYCKCPEQFQEEECKELIQSKYLKNFLDICYASSSTGNHYEYLCDDWKDQGVDTDEGDWSVQAAEGLKLCQTFTDQKHIKDKHISCLNWHPTLYGKQKVQSTPET